MELPPASGRVQVAVREPANQRVLVGCEDPVLLASMARIVAWCRPSWSVEGALGVDQVRRALRERTFDVLVVVVEPRSSGGSAMLKAARIHHGSVSRVAYRTDSACDGTELRLADGVVSMPSDVHALLTTLDTVLSAPPRPSRCAMEPTPTAIPPTGT